MQDKEQQVKEESPKRSLADVRAEIARHRGLIKKYEAEAAAIESELWEILKSETMVTLFDSNKTNTANKDGKADTIWEGGEG